MAGVAVPEQYAAEILPHICRRAQCHSVATKSLLFLLFAVLLFVLLNQKTKLKLNSMV
jgi:hypothetical protein